MTPSSRAILAAMAALAVVGSGAASLDAQAATASSLSLVATGSPGTAVTGARQLTVGGDTPVRIAVTQVEGGTAKVVAGPDSALPRAVRFPSYVGSGTYPRAVLSVTPTAGQALSPGSADFRYGAVFRLNATSSGRSVDNGDNVFQRGLYNEGSVFKLQLDHRYPSCLVKGSAGRVLVRSTTELASNTWYRTTCSRVGNRVSVAVARYPGGAAAVRTAATGATGALAFASSRPASIGGKLNAVGKLVSGDTDQLNGAVAKVWANRL